MHLKSPSRRVIFTKLAAVFLLLPATPVLFAAPGSQAGRPQMAPRPRVSAPHPQQQQKKEHLPQWMASHSNLSPEEQQRALENEQGFRDLPPQTQQRLRNQLSQLNAMNPDQRQRLLERNEAIEHLTVPQRMQVRNAMQQLGALPVDRRRLVARAFRDLREMPPAQRQAILNSDRTRTQFSDQERATLGNLLAVEPYIPLQHPNDNTEYGR